MNPTADWRLAAACRGHDPDMWTIKGNHRGHAYRRAHAICAACPVRQQCRDLADTTGSWGLIFGGRDYRAEPRHTAHENRRCGWCTAPFTSRTIRANYCTARCRQAAYDHRTGRRQRTRTRPATTAA
jgi:transcription factor WhiB